jgi:hypothetical protein
VILFRLILNKHTGSTDLMQEINEEVFDIFNKGLKNSAVVIEE